jgi:hypothetical protein
MKPPQAEATQGERKSKIEQTIHETVFFLNAKKDLSTQGMNLRCKHVNTKFESRKTPLAGTWL